MKVGSRHYHTIWLNPDGRSVDIIDQRWLPHEFRVVTLKTVDDVATAIRDMWVRGAPLIGVTAAYGVAIAMAGDASNAALDKAWETLHVTRPTAINLKWALDDMRGLPARPAGSQNGRKQPMPGPRPSPRKTCCSTAPSASMASQSSSRSPRARSRASR